MDIWAVNGLCFIILDTSSEESSGMSEYLLLVTWLKTAEIHGTPLF